MKKKTMKWMLTAILCICGVSVFTACTPDNNDNPAGDGDLNWEVVSCTGDEMVNKALHRRADGSTYTITAHLKKVE